MKSAGLVIILTLLSACGSQSNKQAPDHQQLLLSALAAGNATQINTHKNQSQLSTKDKKIINLYLSVLDKKPYRVISDSQQIIKNFSQYNSAQQNVLKPMLVWAYAHPIYRQETAKQVRLLQRKTLLVAPSEIDFIGCETKQKGCAHILRSQIKHLVNQRDLTAALITMADQDPCINLTNENLSGDHGNRCLASRKGSLKIELLPPPVVSLPLWQAMFSDTQP